MRLAYKDLIVLNVITDHNVKELERVKSRGYQQSALASAMTPLRSTLLTRETQRFIDEHDDVVRLKFKSPRNGNEYEVLTNEVVRSTNILARAGLIYEFKGDGQKHQFSQTVSGEKLLERLNTQYGSIEQWPDELEVN